ncbi:EAL domain-containing protein [Planomicrobium sp. YIM 101495]|uniref:EAL domain-containing protein n=1 Tax=Planomicrobium sp. YIM 101495 TaxID=2665160 RepID=UPI00351A01DB
MDDVIRNERIFCHYQPILSADRSIYGYELLARFTGEEGTLIYPNEIFSAARSRSHLYALARACRMTAVRHAARLENVKAFINFIPTSIYSPEHCLRSTIELSISLDVNPAQLIFEVVETEKVEDLDHLKRILVYYKERGFNYALDDVGEGYSTMQALAELMPDYMKLDMQYVQGIAEDKEKQRIALKFLAKAKEVGAVPLAEGIEEQHDFEWLEEEGYELFQGYYFGKPAAEPLSA